MDLGRAFVARVIRTVLSSLVAALALATAAGLALEPFRSGSAVHVHWLGASGFHAWVAAAFCASVLLRGPLERRLGRALRTPALAIALSTAALAARGAWLHLRAVAADVVFVRGMFPDACSLAAILLGAWVAVGLRTPSAAGTAPPRPVFALAARAAAVALAGAALVFAWVQAAGAVDYGVARTADAIVVFGSKVSADGTPSGSLLDRTVTACRLWKRGAAPVLVFSGGLGVGAPVSEPEAMRAIALAEGVPAEAIVLDEEGWTTAATVANAASLARERGWRRVFAVSHDYHLARIRLLGDRAGLPVRTVPAVETCSPGWKVFATAREVPRVRRRLAPLTARQRLDGPGT